MIIHGYSTCNLNYSCQNEVMVGYVTGHYIIIKNINDNIYLLLAKFSVCDLWPKRKACRPEIFGKK